VAQAIACYRRALRLDPKNALAHFNLGNALYTQGPVAEAIACYRQVIALDPRYAQAHYNLGVALKAQGQVDQASACYQKAIVLDPKYAEAHCNLGFLLQERGQFTEALATLRRGHQLGSQRPRWSYPSAQWVKQAERLVQLDAQFPKILQRAAQPASAAERIEYAQLCQYKKLYAAAARFCADAFIAEPKLADDLRAEHRYNAACYAALAGAGQGGDAAQLDGVERARWRQQAVAWLQADLTLRAKQLKSNKPVDRALMQQKLRHWQRDPDLAGIRGAAAVAWLPEAERIACRQFWADVDALLKRAGSAK
jgi:tetratricopeptide (TPR) repeat protein